MQENLTEAQRQELFERMARSNPWAAYEAAKQRHLAGPATLTGQGFDRMCREVAKQVGV